MFTLIEQPKWNWTSDSKSASYRVGDREVGRIWFVGTDGWKLSFLGQDKGNYEVSNAKLAIESMWAELSDDQRLLAIECECDTATDKKTITSQINWTPAAESLPRENHRVLVSIDLGYNSPKVEIGWISSSLAEWHFDRNESPMSASDKRLTHWAELPAVPRAAPKRAADPQ